MKLLPGPVAALISAGMVTACGGGGGGASSPPSGPASPNTQVTSIRVNSADLTGGSFPRQLTCDGANRPPAIAWTGAPPRTSAYAVQILDPDAPSGNFTHWLVYNIPAAATQVSAVLPAGAAQGRNDFGATAYGGPCPPPGPAHHYRVVVYALDADLRLPAGLGRADLDQRLQGHIIGAGELVATYARQ